MSCFRQPARSESMGDDWVNCDAEADVAAALSAETTFSCFADALSSTCTKAANGIISQAERDTNIDMQRALAREQGGAMEQRFEQELDKQLATSDPLAMRFVRVPPRLMSTGAPERALWGIREALGMAAEAQSPLWHAILHDGCAMIRREFTTLGEHCTEADRRNFVYVAHEPAEEVVQPNGKVRDEGHGGLVLDDFCRMPQADRAGLTTAHVLALRLYTSNSCHRVNSPLNHGVTPHPHPATTFFVHDAIAKQRNAYARGDLDGPGTTTFWRGLDNMAVTAQFLRTGGTHTGCMSTTTDRAVAERDFARLGRVPNPLLLRIETNGDQMRCGAELAWLSMYPAEAEVVFPPLTLLTPTGPRVRENGCDVVTVSPTFWRGRSSRDDARPTSYHDARAASFHEILLGSPQPAPDNHRSARDDQARGTGGRGGSRSAAVPPPRPTLVARLANHVTSRLRRARAPAAAAARSQPGFGYTHADVASDSFNDSFHSNDDSFDSDEELAAVDNWLAAEALNGDAPRRQQGLALALAQFCGDITGSHRSPITAHSRL